MIRRYDLLHVGGGHDAARPAEFLVDSSRVVRWVNFTEDVRVRAPRRDAGTGQDAAVAAPPKSMGGLPIQARRIRRAPGELVSASDGRFYFRRLPLTVEALYASTLDLGDRMGCIRRGQSPQTAFSNGSCPR